MKHIDTFCPTISGFPYSSSIPLCWPLPTHFQPVSSTSVLAESIQEWLVWCSHPTALGLPDARCHWPFLGQIEHLPHNCLRCHLEYPIPHCSLANFGCPKCYQVCNHHHFWLDNSWFCWFGGHWSLSSSCREVHCGQSLWQRWSFWQFKCSHIIMWKESPGCIDDLFRVQKSSYGCHLLVSSPRFLLCITLVLAALPHPQKVVDLGHSVQCSFFWLYLHFRVVSVFIVSNTGSLPANIPLFVSANYHTTTFFWRVSPELFHCLQPITSRSREKLASTPTACSVIQKMSCATLQRSAYLECVSFFCRNQSVISGMQNILLISIGSKW